MNLILRPEQSSEYFDVEHLIREAFWNIYRPGCDEHLLVHNLRSTTAYIKELSLVAALDNIIIGHVLLSRAYVIDQWQQRHEVLCLGPLSVLPRFQRQGIGSALIRYAIQSATSLGHRAIFLFGRPAYYHRFGFINAKVFEIATRDGENFEAFMAKELYPDSLQNIKGIFFEDDSFIVDEGELMCFELLFPQKQKYIL